jgi:hypothetical protein
MCPECKGIRDGDGRERGSQMRQRGNDDRAVDVGKLLEVAVFAHHTDHLGADLFSHAHRLDGRADRCAAGRFRIQSNATTHPASAARICPARQRARRIHERTVEAGRPNAAAIRWYPSPLAARSSDRAFALRVILLTEVLTPSLDAGGHPQKTIKCETALSRAL